MKRLIKLLLSLGVRLWDLCQASLLRLLGRQPRPVCVVLYYHGIRASQQARFARQMEVLPRLAKPIPADLRAFPDGVRRQCAVTFDDGFVSVIEHALPVLKARAIPAAIFVPSGYLGQRPGWLTDPNSPAREEMVVTAGQLHSLGQEPLITIGSHTVLHRRLDHLADEEARTEIAQSKAQLEAILERPVELLSFPHGAFTQRTLELARQAGYHLVYGISPACAFAGKDRFVSGRVAADPNDWALEFRLKLLGAYRWLAKG